MKRPAILPHLPLLVILVFCEIGCSKTGDSEESSRNEDSLPTLHVKVATATKGMINETIEIPGSIVPLVNQDVKVSSLVAGRVTELRVAEGEPVRRGQLIARIDATPYLQQREQAQASLRQAQTNLENDRREMERNRSLFQKGIAAGKEVQDSEALFHVAEAEVEKARAALQAAELQVKRTEIYSPLSGVVLHRLLNSGEQVSGTASDPIVEVANLDTVEMEARVPSRYLGKVRADGQITVTSASYPGQQLQGKIVAVGGAIDPATDTGQVRLRIRNQRSRLKVGMFVQGLLVLQQHQNATLVPASAVVKARQETHVYVVQGETASERAVSLGIQNQEQAEILSGITPGETVLISGNYGLEDKARVIIDP
jgi:membrane fusion protein, multidrug efflux system